MRSGAFLALLLAALPLAGCLGGSEPTATAPPANATSEGGLHLQAMPSAPPVATNATLDAPPTWRQGEYWNVKVTDAFDGKTFTGTRVVAGAEPDAYLVGMPQSNFSTELMVLHIPGFGQINKKDLSFDVHNKPFAPVQFPLTEGKEWDTAFEGRPVHAKAHVTSPTEAVIAMNGAQDHMNLTYDATIGEIRKIAYAGYADVEITGHGYGYTGIVTVPHMFKLVFQNSRLAGLLSGTTPAAPDEIVKVDTTFDRVSFVVILGNIDGVAPAPTGYYREIVTAPDGTAYDTSYAPPETGGFKLAYFSVDKPGGDWSFRHIAAGPGIALAEGIAYHVYDIDLPSGHVLASKGAHHHGG